MPKVVVAGVEDMDLTSQALCHTDVIEWIVLAAGRRRRRGRRRRFSFAL